MRRFPVLLAVVLAACVALPAGAQSGGQLAITMNVAGSITGQGGAYYIAFTVSDSLLLGPQPDSSNWTHYVLLRDGRFYFGTVPQTAVPPYGFTVIRPPAPFLNGAVLPDGRTLQAIVPLTDLRMGPAPPVRIMVNYVTTDAANRPLDALGPGATDRFGFVTMDLRRDLFVTVRDPRGDCPDPNYDILGGEIRLMTP